MPMSFQRWLLNGLAIFISCLFCCLGLWQLARASEKELLLANSQKASAQKHVGNADLEKHNFKRFSLATLSGHFENDYTFLLDNRTFHNQVGYEVYTPFFANGVGRVILVDRGFIPIGSRDILPSIKRLEGELTITGMINTPPTYVALGDITETKNIQWPLRVEYIDLKQLQDIGKLPFFAFILILDPKSELAYPLEWKINIMPPEKHRAYAFQWFAFALTLLIISAGLNYKVLTSAKNK